MDANDFLGIAVACAFVGTFFGGIGVGVLFMSQFLPEKNDEVQK